MSKSPVNLNSRTVLILNKSWMPINTTTIKHSLRLIYTNNAKSLYINDGNMVPKDWNEWISINADNEPNIKTIRGNIKIPVVIILNFSNKIPKQVIKFTQKNLWDRDNYTCQYTGIKLNKKNGNIDHVVPKSRGGTTSWGNCVLAHKDVNARKANKTPDEIGLKLLKNPKEPRFMPVSFYIRNEYNIKEWDMFLHK
jgi:hypothetical protein